MSPESVCMISMGTAGDKIRTVATGNETIKAAGIELHGRDGEV